MLSPTSQFNRATGEFLHHQKLDKTLCGGTLTFKKLEKDPISFESAMQANSVVSRTADLSPEMMRELLLLVEDARRYYEQNKFIDPDCFARQSDLLPEN